MLYCKRKAPRWRGHQGHRQTGVGRPGQVKDSTTGRPRQEAGGGLSLNVQHEPGKLGQIKLRKIADKRSVVHVVDPPRPLRRNPTPEELEAIATILEREERLRAHAALAKNWRF